MPAKDLDRSKGIYGLWGAGFAFLAALGLVCQYVVRPVMEVGRVIESCHTPASCLIGEGGPLVDKLGGRERASRKLALYLRASALTGHEFGGSRESAAVLLGHCGKWGLMRIIPMIESNNPRVQDDGFHGMCGFFRVPSDYGNFPALKDDARLDPETRELAIKALASLDRMLKTKWGAVKPPSVIGP